MIEIKDKKIKIREGQIRQLFDETSKEWYFSVVDVVSLLAETSDARNYWKTLKNRLRKSQNQLVTRCNQLKMKANDGKFYLTDVANKRTILEIIETVFPDNLEEFENYFNKIKSPDSPLENEISTILNQNEEKTENIIPLDAYQKGEYVFVEAFVGGVNPDNLHIKLGYKKIEITGKRTGENKNNSAEYIKEELIWGNFSRVFSFPIMLDINDHEATLSRGYLKIKIKKLDIEKIKEIRIKSI